MPKSAKRVISANATSSDKPAKPGKAAKRAVNVPGATKPAIAAPADIATVNAAAGVVPSEASIALAAAVPTYRSAARDAAGIVRYATNYAVYSDRDTAYLAFFGNACRANGNAATLRQIHDLGVTRSGMPDRKRFNPNYAGSSKATDVGAINRLCKAGYFTRSADGNTITATALALSSKAYLGT